MMTKESAFCPLLLLVLLGCSDEERRGSRSHTLPSLFVEEAGTMEHDFAVINETKSPIRVLKLASSCSCSEATIDSMTIPPGRTASLRMTANLEGRMGHFMAHCALVRDNGEAWKYSIKTHIKPIASAGSWDCPRCPVPGSQAEGPTMKTSARSRVAPARNSKPGKADAMSEDTPLLTVIVPVYNEAETIDVLLRRVLAAPYAKQVIVVDDGSTDGTAEILETWRQHPQVELLWHSSNRGKSTAIRTGLEQARGRFTIIQDGDLEYDPQEYPWLIEPLVSGEAQVVYGSRYLRRQGGPRQPWRLFRWGVSVLNVCVRLLYGARLTDEATCYKALSTDLLRAMDLQCRQFEFCPEVTAKACRLGLQIKEVPISYDARSVQAGKKIRVSDGLAALATLWKWRNWKAGNLQRRLVQDRQRSSYSSQYLT